MNVSSLTGDVFMQVCVKTLQVKNEDSGKDAPANKVEV